MMLRTDGDLSLRLMLDSDCPPMAAWLSDPRVLQFFEGRDNAFDLDRVRQVYAPAVLTADGVTPCILEFEQRPIGFVQYYRVTEDSKHEYGLAPGADVQHTFALDQFIGEPRLWNRGLGTRAVSLILRHLFEREHARTIVIDPPVDNPRAIRCYEKCGFRKVKILHTHELHEGIMRDCWLMSFERPD